MSIMFGGEVFIFRRLRESIYIVISFWNIIFITIFLSIGTKILERYKMLTISEVRKMK